MGSLAIARLSIIETLRRKEFYVVLVLITGLAVWLQIADLGASQAGRFSREIVMQVIWLAAFALGAALAARQIPSDVEQRTVYVLLARPIPRWQYVAGRGLGSVVAAAACFSGLFLVLVATLALKGGMGVADPTLWQAFALQVIALALLCSVTMLFSCLCSPAGAVTFSLLLLAVMRYGSESLMRLIEQMSGVAQYLAWTAYLGLPHFEFFDISQRFIHGWGPLPAGTFAQVVVYGITYSVCAVAAGAAVFRRKWL